MNIKELINKFQQVTKPVREPIEKYVRKPTIDILSSLAQNTPIGQSFVPQGERLAKLEERYGKGIGTETLSKTGIGSYMGLNPMSVAGMVSPIKIKTLGDIASGGYHITDDAGDIVFRLKGKDVKLNLESVPTRHGFRHDAKLYVDGEFIEKAKAVYHNRTWESYPFQTVIRDLLEKAVEKMPGSL
jgi:hypothetical protein